MNIPQSEHKEKKIDAYKEQKSQRIEALSDGVFAIAMTLLVLDVRMPVTEALHSEKELWAAFVSIAPKFLTFILSFIVTGLFWSVYSNQYNYIHKANRNLNVISIFYLLCISLLPFSAAFLSEHYEFKISILIYGGNIFLSALFLLLHWNYAFKNGLVETESHLEAEINKQFKHRGTFALAFYSVSILACFISTYVSIGMLVAIQLFFLLGGFFEKKK